MNVILEDSRNQIGKHDNINRQLDKLGYKVDRSKLYVGDYQLANNGAVAVDTKQDVLELFGNITSSHERFRNECIRARDAGIQLIILVEEKLPKSGLGSWQSPLFKSNNGKHKCGDKKTNMDPKTARKILVTMQQKYGVLFRFCDPSETGAKILKYLIDRDFR